MELRKKEEEQDGFATLQGSPSGLALVQKLLKGKGRRLAVVASLLVTPGMQSVAISDQRDEISRTP